MIKGKPPKRWRCFFCDAVFTRVRDAEEHFGDTQGCLAACQIKGHENNLIRVIREQEKQLETYRNEDGEIMRAMQTLQSEQNEALRRMENIGFARGIRDMTASRERMRALCGRALSGDLDKRSLKGTIEQIIKEL